MPRSWWEEGGEEKRGGGSFRFVFPHRSTSTAVRITHERVNQKIPHILALSRAVGEGHVRDFVPRSPTSSPEGSHARAETVPTGPLDLDTWMDSLDSLEDRR